MKPNHSSAKPALTRRRVIDGIVLLAVLGGVALWAWWTFGDPPAAWVVRWRIDRYLKQQTGRSDFPAPFTLPSRQLMSKAAPDSATLSNTVLQAGPITKKDFNTLCNEYLKLEKEAIVLRRTLAAGQRELEEKQARLGETGQATNASTAGASNRLARTAAAIRERVEALKKDLPARQQELARQEETIAPLLSDLWAFQRTWAFRSEAEEAVTASAVTAEWNRLSQELRGEFNEAPSWAAMYELIGQELWVARRLFRSANQHHQRLALTIGLRSSRDALGEAQNGWLAARICEGYVLPYLDLAEDAGRRAPLSLENVLSECAAAFRSCSETQSVMRSYELLLSKASASQRADWARVQLSVLHEQAGDNARALKYLKQVRNTNDFRWELRRIPRLEQRLKWSG